VTGPSPTDRALTEAAKPTAASAERKSEATRAEEAAAKLPPLKALTLNEVRVMLGAIPASVALKMANKPDGGLGAFDMYA
jgi:hypothetical protein